MAVPFVLANAMAVAQDGFQMYLSENRSSFLRDFGSQSFSSFVKIVSINLASRFPDFEYHGEAGADIKFVLC